MRKEHFYKYSTINQNFYSSIINNELFFSNPRNFNDPFDSYPRFSLTSDEIKLKSFFDFLGSKLNNFKAEIFENSNNLNKHEQYKRLIETFFSAKLFEKELYENEILDKTNKLIELYTFYSDESNFEKLLAQNSEYLQIKMYHDYIFIIIDQHNIGVSCGSNNPKCPVMWGHYANNHKGICIKYDLGNDTTQNICFDTNEKLDVLKVNYSDDPINIFDYSIIKLEDLKFKILSNKYSKWKYENEIRLIHKDQGSLKIKRSSITEIIFGCKSTPKDRYSTIKLFASLGYKTNKLLIAKRLPDKYELSIQKMTMNDIAGSGVYIEEMNL
ncbi:DUF2971 domain-containing protein [Winogradskyella sp.]|uniref:DUF2971 domain-containing protein n=1 Tax=Winogradskyella sp. TaxID=1883156 RepID=UPI002617D050|nr:DUF2971 domain-containing protein [Winogradskyella sp.]